MHESVNGALKPAVCPGRAPTRGWRRWTRGLEAAAAALLLWGCGGDGPLPEESAAPEPEPVAVASSASALVCPASDITNGTWRCAGAFTYSLECYALMGSAACGQDLSPKTCTTYNTCEHPDFGFVRQTHTTMFWLSERVPTCESAAFSYITGMTPEESAGMTYTWTWSPAPYPPEEGPDLGVCNVTFENHPFGATGTGPQCGTTESSCTSACVNPQTCRLNGVWVTGPQCGTLVGPCSATSLSPVYDQCRDASHGTAPDAQCGAGFESAQAPAGSTPAQVEALAAAQWAAAKSLGTPVYDGPVTCSDCRGTLTLTRQEVARRVYATAGMAKKDPALHILAGAAYFLAMDGPALTQAQLTAHLNTLASAVAASRIASPNDGSNLVRRMLRILYDLEYTPSLPDAERKALRAYSRELLAAMRQGLAQERRLAPLLEQVDRTPEAEEYLAKAWGRLFDLSATRPALAAAVNNGGIGAALGISTTATFQQMLDVYPVEPLKSFVLAHVDPEGGISATRAELMDLVGTASGTGLAAATAYSDSLLLLNEAQDTYVAARTSAQSLASATSPEDAFKAAIDAAKVRNENLKNALKDTKEIVSSSAGLVIDFLDPEDQGVRDVLLLGRAVEQTFSALEQYSASSVKIAEKLVGVLELGASAFELISAAVFTGQMVGAVLKVLDLFGGKKPQQTTDEKILVQVNVIKGLVVKMHTDMKDRFDRTDRNISRVFNEMNQQFANVNWTLGVLTADVNQLQRAIYSTQGDINRLDGNVYSYLAAVARQSFVEQVNGDLEWRLKVTDPDRQDEFTFGRYETAENKFQSWAAIHSKADFSAGTEARSFGDDMLLTELGNHPIAFNINYLRVAPAAKFQMDALSSVRLSNPLDWVAASEAWMQLAEEWPGYASSFGLARRTEIRQRGEELREALRKMEQPLLYEKLATHYEGRWSELKARINEAEEALEDRPMGPLYGVDLWSGPDQRPDTHWLAQNVPHELGRCDGAPFKAGTITRPLVLGRWPHEELKPFMMAHNLGVGTLSACAEARWDDSNYSYTELGTYYWYKLYVEVHIRYTDTSGSTILYTHRFNSNIERTYLVRPNQGGFNPNTHFDTYAIASDNWGPITNTEPVKRFRGDSKRAQVRPQVSEALTAHQRAFYRDVASRMTQAGDPIGLAAQQLSGSRMLWESYITMGLPLSLANNEALRGLLYGEDKVISGGDVKTDNALPDDVHDVYWLFGNAAQVPAYNILTDLDGTVTVRAERLESTLSTILARLQSTGAHEADAWVDATLLRLQATSP